MENLKAIIEKPVTFLNDDERNHNMLCEFNTLLQCITLSFNENQLRQSLNNAKIIEFRYFNYGFGSNHMWINQKNIRTPKNNEIKVLDHRILIVELEK